MSSLTGRSEFLCDNKLSIWQDIVMGGTRMRTIALVTTILLLAASSATAQPDKLLRSAKSGAWSDSATWEGGNVPAANARVQVRPGHTVAYDAKSDAIIRFIHVGGTLIFAHDKDTL